MTVAIEPRRGGQFIFGSGGGGKGGGGSRTSVESPDSLHNTSYAAVLDVIGNGEMAGPAHPDSPLRDIFLDGTPVQNEDGSLNFNRVQVDYRVGTNDQEHIPGFPASASVTQVGAEIKVAQPWVQLLSNTNLSAVRVGVHVPRLVRLVDSGGNAGDRVGYRVEYAIDLAVDGGSFVEQLRTSFDGKTINGYTRTHRIDLPTAAEGWTVRVRRLTPEATTSEIEDKIYAQSYAEVIDGKFVYPMTALVGIKIDAEQFQSIPTRSYRWRGQIIRVPSNYDPITRTYTGVWDGTFKRAWSNNPAWIYFDMLTNKLYGLGDRIDASMIDRYALYQIGAYCDQMVSDGLGGQEPRFVCNMYLQSQADALRVLNDLTSTFRGMTYWANGQVVAVADAPSDPVYTYTNGSVIDGRVEYTGADLSTLKTVALVSWNDPSDFYRPKVEAVEDDDGIRQYGIRKTDVVAFGCTSRGQAQRVGLYHLYTSRMETGGVAFSVGLDGVIPQPGSIVRVADRNRAGRHIGGRIKQATASTVTVDRDHPIKAGNTLTVNLPTGQSETRPVSLVSDRVVTVNPAFSQVPAPEAVWAVDADDLVTQHVRVVSVKERDGIVFDISGVFHHPGKYAAIDRGVRLDPLPVSVVPPRTQMAPSNVQIREHYVVRQGQSRHIAEITWDAVENALMYDVQWRRDNSGWVQVPRTGERLVEIPDFYTGEYSVRVRAINGLDVPSLWAYSVVTTLTGRVSAPLPVTHLVTSSIPWGIRLGWGFPTGPNIIERTEIRYSSTQDFADSLPAGGFAYPSDSFEQTGLAITTQHFFWARLIDKNGTLGPWYPSESGSGVRGTPNQTANDYNDLITPEIVAGGLGELLMGNIREIPSIKDAVGDLTLELGELNQRVDEVNEQVQELLNANEWDATAIYAKGAVVFFEGKMYRAKIAVPTGTPITSTAHWDLIGDYASITDGLAALAVQSQETISRVENAEGRIQANAEQISTVAGKIDDPSTGLGALGSAVQSMRTQVGQLQDGLQSLSDATTVLSSKVEGLEEVQDGLATAISQLTTRVRTTEDKLEVQASSITQLKTDLGALASPSGNLLLDSSVELVRSTPVYLFGRYYLAESFESEQDYTLVVNYTHIPAAGDTTAHIAVWAAGGSNKVGELDKNVVKHTQVLKFSKNPSLAAPKELRFYYGPNPGTHAGEATIHWATLYKGAVIPAMEWQPSLGDVQAQIQANASAVVGLSTKVTQQGSTITSQGESLAILQNEVRDPSTGLAATAGALNNTKSRVTDVEGRQEAMASNQLILAADLKRQMPNEDAELERVLNQWKTQADLSEFKRVQVDETRALAESVETLEAGIGESSAAVEQVLRALVELDGKISSSWGVKLQANQSGVHYVSGVGLDLTNESGVMQSTFAVLADRFAVMHATNGDPVTVFSVQGGASILNTALIGFASITEAKIANAAISRAKIQDAAINAAKIENAAITSAKIQDAAIKTAHIGHGEVDTLRLAGNAVAVQVGASADVRYSQDDWVYLTLNLYVKYVAEVTILAVVGEQYSSWAAGTVPVYDGLTSVQVNGVSEATLPMYNLNSIVAVGGSVCVTTQLQPGTHQITLVQKATLFAGQGSGQMGRRQFAPAGLSVISTMR